MLVRAITAVNALLATCLLEVTTGVSVDLHHSPNSSSFSTKPHQRDGVSQESSSGVQQNFGVGRAVPLPILDIGGMYIKGQVGYATQNATLSTISRHIPLNKRVDGPIQCSATQPCLDKSCCNSDGKCGYKKTHCALTTTTSCLSNCDAKAMCGIDSPDGAEKCGLNLCCSFYGWCGTEDVHCINGDPQGATSPCQAGYGGCEIVPPPSCGTGSGTASNGRKVAYYQSWNTRNRKCNRVFPNQINTKGLTHLNLAFASIDPASYEVVPANPADEDIYLQFTSLKSSKMQTWIAVGGFDFSDPGTPTHTTWSDMASTKANRAAFISSVIAFMNRWGFQGMDLDWEYPATEVRGGKKEDTANLVSLVKELREAFGTKYGLSSILAPDYWYLRGMDPKAMEPYVDFFGFMAYDLHGAWDSAIDTIGSTIRPQTDIREIDKDLLPLWFDRLNPSKVNFGLAYYGRGYTVSDRSCMYPGCLFEGASKPTGCTDQAGVMSNREIQHLIAEKSLYVELLRDPMIKMIAWDDQWIGFDDNETIEMKTGVANNLCLGGTMIWSIDFDAESGGSGDTPDGGEEVNNNANGPVVYFDSSVWKQQNPTFQCTPPCVMIIPPMPLPQLSTISMPPFTTTLWSSTQGSILTKTTVVSVASITTSYINFWPITVQPGDTTQATFQPVQSVMPPSLTITLPGTEAFIPPSLSSAVASSASTTVIPILFAPTPRPIIIQPMATHSVDLVPSLNPSGTYKPGPTPTPDCNGSQCGERECNLFGCAAAVCGLFGCGGGCGMSFCPGQGGCTLKGCGGSSGCEGSNCNVATKGPPPDCEPSLDIEPNLCSNGNYPIYNVDTQTVSCNGGEEGVDTRSSCQLYADSDEARPEITELLESVKGCTACGGSARQLAGRADGDDSEASYCLSEESGAEEGYKELEEGKCHSTFTCTASLWPNVCANARSAITERGRASILTYLGDGAIQDVDLWPKGKKWIDVTKEWLNGYKVKRVEGKIVQEPVTPATGWGLIGCEIEEYPWSSGSGHFPGWLSEGSVTDPMKERAVNRLIYYEENGSHGAALRKFYKRAADDAGGSAFGLSYCVDFQGAFPAGRGDDAYLLDSTAHNICAQPYGVGFTLVTNAYQSLRTAVTAGKDLWDPWFNREAGRKPMQVTLDDETKISVPPQYCEAPSPGRKAYDKVAKEWKIQSTHLWGTPSGPDTSPDPAGKRVDCIDPLASNAKRHAQRLNGTSSGNMSSSEGESPNGTSRDSAVSKRATTGSFLDARIYDYLGCLNDDYDPCSYGYCDDGFDLGDSKADEEDPATGSTPTTTLPATSPTAPPTTSAPVSKPPAPTSSPATTSKFVPITIDCTDPSYINTSSCLSDDRGSGAGPPFCEEGADCISYCHGVLAGDSDAIKWGTVNTCFTDGKTPKYCTCSTKLAQVSGEILIVIGKTVCVALNEAVSDALDVISFVVPYAGPLAGGAVVAQFFSAAGKVLKIGAAATDCLIPCGGGVSGKKYTWVEPLDSKTWVDINECA